MSDDPGTRINQPGHFTYIDVYERGSGHHLSHSILWDNPEYIKLSTATAPLRALIQLLLIALVVPGFFLLVSSAYEQAQEGGALVVIIVYLIAAVFAFDFLFYKPIKVKKRITLDWELGRIQVFTNHTQDFSFDFRHTFPQFTIEEHPDTELARHNAQMEAQRKKRPAKMTDEEKSHALVGYFGVKHGTKKMLCHRAEPLSTHRLMEVQAALQWAKERYDTQKYEPRSARTDSSGEPEHATRPHHDENPPED